MGSTSGRETHHFTTTMRRYNEVVEGKGGDKPKLSPKTINQFQHMVDCANSIKPNESKAKDSIFMSDSALIYQIVCHHEGPLLLIAEIIRILNLDVRYQPGRLHYWHNVILAYLKILGGILDGNIKAMFGLSRLELVRHCKIMLDKLYIARVLVIQCDPFAAIFGGACIDIIKKNPFPNDFDMKTTEVDTIYDLLSRHFKIEQVFTISGGDSAYQFDHHRLKVTYQSASVTVDLIDCGLNRMTRGSSVVHSDPDFDITSICHYYQKLDTMLIRTGGGECRASYWKLVTLSNAITNIHTGRMQAFHGSAPSSHCLNASCYLISDSKLARVKKYTDKGYRLIYVPCPKNNPLCLYSIYQHS